jgi:hypothetical protein
MFTFDKKQNHVAQVVNLPPAPPLTYKISDNQYYPPMLIINLQLPTYSVSLSV